MLKVSPNKVSHYAKCPASAGYHYDPRIDNRSETRDPPSLTKGRNRGLAIHRATLGETPEVAQQRLAGPRLSDPALTSGRRSGLGAIGTEYPEEEADLDQRIIWHVLNVLWPGAIWHKEQVMSTPLTPNITLEGRLDMWGIWQGAYILPDLKTSTSFTTSLLSGFCDDFDRQLILYGRLVRDHVHVLPQVWRLGYNPTTKKIHRRQYPLSDTLIDQASRYAIHVACALERMAVTNSLEWLRSMQCCTPFPCAYKKPCARDTGAWYTDGKNSPPQLPEGEEPRAFENPVDVTL